MSLSKRNVISCTLDKISMGEDDVNMTLDSNNMPIHVLDKSYYFQTYT
jgi:hypothetical protein